MHSLLLLLPLLCITNCTVYTVIPDYGYNSNATCHHCHSLQHYLLNTTKYFTSNTQLLFLPGLYCPHTNFILKNVYNFSIIGCQGNTATPHGQGYIRVQCDFIFILMSNISRLIIKNIAFTATNPQGPHKLSPLLTIKDCSSITFYNLEIFKIKSQGNISAFHLVIINVMGNSSIGYVKSPGMLKMLVLYNRTHSDKKYHVLTVNNCEIVSIKVSMLQNSYKVTLMIINMQLYGITNNILLGVKYDSFIYADELGASEVIMINCKFIDYMYTQHLFFFASSSNGSVKFIDCQFVNNSNLYSTIFISLHNLQLGPRHYEKPALIKIKLRIKLEFKNCFFQSDSEHDGQMLQTDGSSTNPSTIIINNSTFSYYINKTINPYMSWYNTDTFDLSFIVVSNVTLILENSVAFRKIATLRSVISLKGNSTIIIRGSVEFSHNQGDDLINFYDNYKKYIIIEENSTLNLTHNEAWSLFAINPIVARYPYPFCIFQYFGNWNKSKVPSEKRFLITFYNNQCKDKSDCYNYKIFTHCLWLPQSLFINSIPLEVNSKYIQFVNNDSTTHNLSQKIEQDSLCVCTNELNDDCQIFNLGYAYPGQTLAISLYQKDANTANAVVVKTDIDQQYVTPCIVLEISENLQIIEKQCTSLNYTIGFPTESHCELFLKIASDSDEHLNIFSIKQLECPTGFVKIDKRCQCDPVLVQYGITNCNINDQTIIRPANSWISATTHNNSYTYRISLYCPFHYCLPYSSHFNFSTPNSQCQFNRSDLVCGHCQQGLSTVFSSSYCRHCSNTYLLLIIPIAIAGVVLVLLLFILNLTVTDGIINGFIFYVNVISINTPVFFTELNHFTPFYTFISIANLDFGIQTCFYNGMDDYAKMWLQLAFPFYLIFIATLIIITSRYSTTIQRLTARRALRVLATLFLLSYTKILRIVSSVLFFYSTITHLPSKHTTLVWSVDANVPLFGVRFTVLFIVCLILFLILVPFNVILLFTRTLSRFRFINKFKPLLDAYQGPYKYKYYYWTGLQLLIRAVFFGISSLDRNINLTISIILLGILVGIHGIVRPFKMMYKNYQELVLILNLQALYAISLYHQDYNNQTIITIMISVAAMQFSFIITYHMITYACGGVIRNKIQSSINTFTGRINRLYKKSQPHRFQLEGSIRESIPEVAFKYHEFREPLLDQDQS